MQAPERELYNQSADPAAARNLAGDTKAVADTMAAQLDDFHQKTSQTLIDLAKPDPDQMKKLQALGYVGSAAGKEKEEKKHVGIDTKNKNENTKILKDDMVQM